MNLLTLSKICKHAMTRYGLCVVCGAITTPGMRDHIQEAYKAGDCPWCAHSEPDSVCNGSPIDWYCKKCAEPCYLIRDDVKDCQDYEPRRVDVHE